MRMESLTLAAPDVTPAEAAAALGSTETDSRRSRATAALTSIDTPTLSALARITSAAFKPRISTVTKSWGEVFMSRRKEGSEAFVKLAAGRLSLHSPMHSVWASIEVTGPMISSRESSKRQLQACPRCLKGNGKATEHAADPPQSRCEGDEASRRGAGQAAISRRMRDVPNGSRQSTPKSRPEAG
jgi:hypothetical protein